MRFTNEYAIYILTNPTTTEFSCRLEFVMLEDEPALESLFDSDPGDVYCGIVFTAPDRLDSKLEYKLRFSSENSTYVLPPADNLRAAQTTCRGEKKTIINK